MISPLLTPTLHAFMKIILAPPRSNLIGASRLFSNIYFGDNIAAVRSVYQALESGYGKDWFFKKEVTPIKNLQMAKIRESIQKYVTARDVLATSETGLFKSGDLGYVVVPSPTEIWARNEMPTGEFQYTTIQQMERIIGHFARFAKLHNLKVYTDTVPAVTDLLAA